MKLIKQSVTIIGSINEPFVTLKFITTRTAAITIKSGKVFESTIEYGNPIQFIKPSWLDYNNSKALHAFNTACCTALASYNKLRSLGFTHGLIHNILPSVVKVILIVSNDLESWRKFLVYPTTNAELRDLQVLTRYELIKIDGNLKYGI